MTWKLPLDSVLVPYAFTPACDEALRVAQTFVADPSHLHVLYVSPIPMTADPAAIWGHIDANAAKENAERSLSEAMANLGLGAQQAVRMGQPGDEVAEYAEACGAKLIVMPSHGRRGIRRVLLGSVTERVMRLAQVPVLVIRTFSSSEGDA